MAEVPSGLRAPVPPYGSLTRPGVEASTGGHGVSAPPSPLHHQVSSLWMAVLKGRTSGVVAALGVRGHATLAPHCHTGARARRCLRDSRPGAHGQANLCRGDVSPAAPQSHTVTYREARLLCGARSPLPLCLDPLGDALVISSAPSVSEGNSRRSPGPFVRVSFSRGLQSSSLTGIEVGGLKTVACSRFLVGGALSVPSSVGSSSVRGRGRRAVVLIGCNRNPSCLWLDFIILLKMSLTAV